MLSSLPPFAGENDTIAFHRYTGPCKERAGVRIIQLYYCSILASFASIAKPFCLIDATLTPYPLPRTAHKLVLIDNCALRLRARELGSFRYTAPAYWLVLRRRIAMLGACWHRSLFVRRTVSAQRFQRRNSFRRYSMGQMQTGVSGAVKVLWFACIAGQ